MKKKILPILILLCIIIIVGNTVSIADVGSFERYDSGYSSGFSSGSSGWDYDDDSGSSSIDIIELIWLVTWLLGTPIGRIIFVILIVVAIIYYKKYKNVYRPMHNNYNVKNTSEYPHKTNYALEIKNIDPNFSEEKMLAWSKDLFVKLQNAWTARDWEPMRPFETESLFEQHKVQVQGYIDTNRINVIDRIAVNYASIYKFKQEGDRDILEISLKATMKDYIIDDKTKEVLEGNKTQDRVNVYKMTFERKTGVLTPEGTNEIKTTNCPNCGAPTEITSAGKCSYCGSVITTGANTWVLSGLEPLTR